MQPSCKGLQEVWSENTPTKSQAANFNESGGHVGPSKDNSSKVKSSRYTDLRATFKHIYRSEGAIAFSKGILPRMSINVPSTALSWGTYELIKNLLVTQEGRR